MGQGQLKVTIYINFVELEYILLHAKFHDQKGPFVGAPRGFGGSGEIGLFIFRELESTANYFRGAGEQTHTFGDLGSNAKK